ncbi:MAG: helix-turn-helix domain-containing protein [Oscillospiraceae bacterium]|nr:helix-turn-helix domain-containing protein [Oscillospiraceae bacterium]
MRTGIDQALLSKYENGERVPTVENLTVLADYFDTSLDYLMDRTSQEKPYPRKG